ncbi:Metallothiol transferase FosB 2 [Legionella massiliensis]|uniref:Metallothiol transferase FosB 2 n=2 Tax=Legionella massiliensis TaxID=1034943 RepID=A0A078KZN3_9GAMM|nr:Metallothiol transferase FosB 2 [Legionella massiliensis]CEE12976.1 Metallothiol transferase FosB 2 [Legionella massiliensis]
MQKPNLVGINHVALEVGNIEEALSFYEEIFSFKLRGKGKSMAFIDLGDQFLALMKSENTVPDKGRHFGLVVDNRNNVKELAIKAGAKLIDGQFLDFLDPWGNRIQVVEYADIQFTKAPQVLKGMHLDIKKNQNALKELKDKGMN